MIGEKQADTQLVTFRAQFPHTERGICYLNHAAQSPLAYATVEAINEHLSERHNGMMMTYPMDMEVIARCRERIRILINAPDVRQIAFIGNTSEGLNRVTSGLDWLAGDEIILNSIEFPSNVYPYRKLEPRGVRCVFVDAADGTVPVERIEAAITSRTRMVAISAVQFLSGWRADMEAIGALCRRHDLLFVVDGIQAAGVTPVDVQRWGADAFATGGLKWLMAPMGIGFLYLSDRLCDRLATPDPGWLSVEDPWDLLRYDQPMRTDAGRFEGGVSNIPGIYGLDATLGLLLETGIDRIFRQVLDCNRQLRYGIRDTGLEAAGLTPYTCTDPARQSGILTYILPADIDHEALESALRDQGIFVSIRDRKLRFSPHGYNTAEEIHSVITSTERIYSGLL
ncbi:MAG: aminotransferase class V-fold PLP-dependent enzyme [Cyclonatronaceae bacterium]